MLLCPAAPARAALHEHVLSNGMKVIVKEDRRAPVVVSMVWYRAGSMDESTGTTGVAHVLEHMMFKGTRCSGRASSRAPSPAQAAVTMRSPTATTPRTTSSCTSPI